MSEDNEHLLKNTIRQERDKVCEMVRKLGPKLSGLIITCGFIVFAFSIYLLLMPQDSVLSTRLGIVFTSSLGFVGGLNILSGLLLLLGED